MKWKVSLVKLTGEVNVVLCETHDKAEQVASEWKKFHWGNSASLSELTPKPMGRRETGSETEEDHG
jgi:hypothetical protein